MRFLKRILSFVARSLTTARWRAGWIVRIANLGGDDLLQLAYHQMGILKFKNTQVSGEDFLIRDILPQLVSHEKPVFLDVGANIGDFSMLLRRHFPAAVIHAFEPVAATFARLQENTASVGIQCQHMGLGDQAGAAVIYLNNDPATSTLATLYQDVAQSIHRFDRPRAETITIQTLDAYCAAQGLTTIDFLKVDTEGHEFHVLQGGQNLIQRGNVGIIQFEFNEMNIFARVYLKDFYDLLPGYHFYRLDTNRLIPLGAYKPRYEIFQFQNIVAVPERLHVKIGNKITTYG